MDEQITTQFCDTNDNIDNKIFMLMAKKGEKKALPAQAESISTVSCIISNNLVLWGDSHS